MELYEETIESLYEKLNKKEIKPADILDSIYERIDTVEDKVKAYILPTKEIAYKMAEKAEKMIISGEGATRLTGIPIGLKDNMVLEGVPTTCGAKMLENYRPPYTATVLKKLEEAGAVFTGKLNMDEYAFGSSTENSAFFATRNPWDTQRVPGGSSGGSAAAVAAGMASAALGSDTGGSIKQPASLCGVTGMRATYGRVSRYGLVAFGSSLDQIGPLAKTAADSAIIMKYIAGCDEKDSTSASVEVPDYYEKLSDNIKGKVIGIPDEYFIEGTAPRVKESVMEALKVYEELGAKIERIRRPHTIYSLDVYYIAATAEASSNLARFDGVQYGLRDTEAGNLIEMYKKSRQKGFGPETKRRIVFGTYVLSSGYYDAYYKKAQKARTLLAGDFKKAFEKVDVIATPTSPTTAFKVGEKSSDPLTMYLSDIFTIAPNLAALPGISIPCGFDEKNLPIGMQIIGRAFAEQDVYNTAYAYQKNTQWHKKNPVL